MNSLQRYLGVVLKHRRFVFWEVVIVTVAVIIFSLVAAPIFTSVAQILPPSSDESSYLSLPSMLGSSGLSSVMRLGSTLRGTQTSDLVAAILNSRTVRERVIDSCDFMRVYKFKKDRENALRKLTEMTRVHVTDEGIVVLGVEGKTAQYAARLATSYVDELDRFMRESNMSRGRAMRIFLEKRLVDAKVELDSSEVALTSFQKENRVTAVDEETKAAVESYAKLRAEKMASDIDLGFATEVAGSANTYVQNLKEQNTAFARQLSKFEVGGTGGTGFGVGSGVPLKGVPDIAAEYMRLLADYTVKQELRALLLQQYEQARITEVRDTPAITVLDPPKVPEKRSFPKRTRMVAIAFGFSLVAGIAISLLWETWDRQRQNERTWQEWQRIAQTLKGDVRRVFRRNRRPDARPPAA